jgi:hypothetical protein
MVAATGTMNSQPGRFRSGRTVTLMSPADAAGMRRRSCGRERQRKEISDKHDEQHKSGSQALHAFKVNRNPEVEKA